MTAETCTDKRALTGHITERQLQETILEAAALLGYHCYHTFDARRSQPGFPDIIALRPKDGRRFALELKTAKGRVRPEQQTWLQAFALCGVPAFVVRPQDLDFVLEMLK